MPSFPSRLENIAIFHRTSVRRRKARQPVGERVKVAG